MITDHKERLVRSLDWNLLWTFILIVREKGISKAAHKLHLSQPAISMALKRLEEQLGHRLIERSARSFRVTDAGQRLYEETLEIHSHVSRLWDVLNDAGEEVVGQVRLVVASGIYSSLLDSILAEYHRAYPDVRLRLDVLPSADILGVMQQGLATAGICLVRNTPPNLRAELFMNQQFGLFCGRPHRLFGRTDVSIQELRNEPFVTFHSDSLGEVLSPLTVFREQHGFDGPVIGSSLNLNEIRRMVFAGYGIGLLPIHAAHYDIKSGRLWQLPPLGGIGPINLHFIWKPEALLNRAAELFVETAIREIKETRLDQRLDQRI